MTFDEGILTVYSVYNSAEKGKKPVYSLKEKSKHYYSFSAVGINRYYTALQAKQKIENVVNIPEWDDITTDDMVRLENGNIYKIAMVQKVLDDENLKITKLSLERTGDIYGLSGD